MTAFDVLPVAANGPSQVPDTKLGFHFDPFEWHRISYSRDMAFMFEHRLGDPCDAVPAIVQCALREAGKGRGRLWVESNECKTE